MADRACETVADMVPELALGISDGLERAAVLAHVEQCPACRAELDRLMSVVDGLTALTPPVEPPAGFETKVLTALGHAAPARRWRRAVAAVAIAAAVAIVGGVVGWTVHDTPGKGPTVAALDSVGGGGQTIGLVAVESGAHPWMSMSVSADLTKVRCQVQTATGRWHTVGTYYDAGYWNVKLPAGSEVTAARLVSHGKVVATADLS